MKKVFQEIDQGAKGWLDKDDLTNMAKQLKEDLSEDDIKIIMRKLDPKRTGRISIEAFMEFNRQKIF